MRQNELTGLLRHFSAEVFQRTHEQLQAAGKTDSMARVHTVFQTLTAELSAPGITQLAPFEVSAGQISASGWCVPQMPEASDGKWPVWIAEISGTGAPYLKVEQIRTSAFVIPLKLNTASPRFAGAAMAITLLHACGAYVQQTGNTPQRNLRFVFTSCDEAFELFLEQKKPLGPQVFSAMEIDLLTRKTKSPVLHVDSARYGQRSFVADALIEFFGQTAIREQTAATASLALRPFGIPFARLQGTLPADSHSVKAAGRALLRTIALLGDTDYESALKFIRPRLRRTAAEMRAHPENTVRIYRELQGRLRGFDQLLHRGPWWVNPRSTILRHRREGYLIDGIYYPRSAYQVWLEKEDRRLKALLPEETAKPAVSKISPALRRRAGSFVPVCTFNGALSLESAPAPVKRRLKKSGAANPAALPAWMQMAADNAAGKNTVTGIFTRLSADGFKPGLKQLLGFFELLEKCGKVKRRPVITSPEILTALRAAGIQEGDLVMIHTGYAAYGYIKAGPKGLIDLFQQAVGPSGTVCMPAHTVSLVGNPPFDHDCSPAQTGLVPTLFAKAPGTLRGQHPTHSVAARGPLAEFLLERADAREPVFGHEGFWGRFHDANGKVLMFCNSLVSNTFLHGVDYMAGAALPDSIAHRVRNGKREEVTVRGIPFHTDSFPHIYKALEKKKMIHSAPLGSGTVYVMNARELMKTGLPVVRRNPLLATAPGCTCDYCEHLRRASH